MGLFSKRHTEPIVHPPVERSVHVAASPGAVVGHLGAYSSLWSPKRATIHQLRVGVVGDWSAIRLPDELHPWQLHNLAMWMLDCPGADGRVIAVSAESPTHPGYWLVPDPEVPDALCGWDELGSGWTVHVPGNDIVRGEDVPVERAVAVPSGHTDWHMVDVLLDEVDRGMNESNESTSKSRRHLQRRNDVVVF